MVLSTDNSHLRKYLATLGVAVVAGVISLSGLALRLQDDLLVKESELRELTPLARETVEQRQRLLATVTDVLPWFLLVGVAGGVTLTVYGLVGWSRRQKVADRREDIGARREEIEFERLTPAEQQERREREVASEVPDEPPVPNSRADTFADLERQFGAKLVAALGPNHVEVGVRAHGPGGEAEFDAMVLGRGTTVLELRYLAHPGAPDRRLREARRDLADAIARVGGAITRGVVVAVLADGVQVAALRSRTTVDGIPVDVHVFGESQFVEMSPHEFVRQLGL